MSPSERVEEPKPKENADGAKPERPRRTTERGMAVAPPPPKSKKPDPPAR